jgi:hypothetical protein
LPAEEIKFDWVARLGIEAETEFNTKDQDMLINVITIASKLVMLACWLCHRYVVESQPVTSTETLEHGVIAYSIDTGLKMAIQEFNDVSESLDASGAFGNVFSRLRQKAFVFVEPWKQAFLFCIAGSLSSRLQHISQTTDSMCPSWKYFIDDTKYTKMLAVKHLLTPTAKFSLGLQANAHFGYVVGVSEVFERWGLDALDSNEICKKDYKHSDEVLKFAQLTVLVVAAVSVLEATSAVKQSSAATVLLDQPLAANLPLSLKKSLSALKSKTK